MEKPINICNFFYNCTFSYEQIEIDNSYEDNEYGEIYYNVVILESINPKFKKGDKIDRLYVKIEMMFEHEDGSEY